MPNRRVRSVTLWVVVGLVILAFVTGTVRMEVGVGSAPVLWLIGFPLIAAVVVFAIVWDRRKQR